ncbi:MAG: ElyC/SanA/YdcF family protein [Candidatus Saccharimonadales bacterium]
MKSLFTKRRIFVLLLGFVLVVFIVFGPLLYTFTTTRSTRYDLQSTSAAKVPFHRVALVLGAGVLLDGTPTPYLRNRIETATHLYKAHRVQVLLMSGDNSTKQHNEPVAMKNYAVKLGVKSHDIVLDYAGLNTYDSCYRAHAIFGLRDATIVSQSYHLPRAMTTCRGLGIANVGVAAVHLHRDYTDNYLLREVVSTDKMVFQLLFKPHPTALGMPSPIK